MRIPATEEAKMSDIGDWFRSIPTITRYWFAATVAVPLVGKLGLISPAYFFLWPEAFLYRFQVLTDDRASGAYRPQVAPPRRSVDWPVADARCLVGLVVQRLPRFRAGSFGPGVGWTDGWTAGQGVRAWAWIAGDMEAPRFGPVGRD